MQKLNMSKSNLAKKFQLKSNRSWRIFLVDIVKNFVSVFFSAQRVQVFPIAFPHHSLNGFCFVRHKVCDPNAASNSC